ncbi:MAG: PQQ-binding-like beta-propeller repeat protein [Planctomycetaceae bacterium]
MHRNSLHRMHDKPIVILCFLTMIVGGAAMLPAEEAVPAPQSAASRGGLILADRRDMRRLEAARDLLADRKFPDAIELLQTLLDGREDGFFPNESAPKQPLRSLKAEARQLIGSMPQEGRDAYELRYGTVAQGDLNNAYHRGDWPGVAEVARRYLHTDAGYEATYAMGVYQLDRGHPFAASLCLKRLRAWGDVTARWEPAYSLRLAMCLARIGETEEAGRTLTALRGAIGDDGVIVAGRNRKLPAEPAELDEWMTQVFGPAPAALPSLRGDWTLVRGNAARNAVVAPLEPALELSWPDEGFFTLLDPLKDKLDDHRSDFERSLSQKVESLAAQVRANGVEPLPSLNPLVVEGLVLVRTLGNVTALELGTGERRWDTFSDETLDLLLSGDERAGEQKADEVLPVVRQRLWDDRTFGTLSSDGQRVYLVDDLGVWPRLQSPDGNSNVPARNYNRLTAHDLKTGLLLWEVGGDPHAVYGPLELAGVFFLGAPLPLGERLYCLVEGPVTGSLAGGVQLAVLDAATGDLEWSQSLADPNAPIDRDYDRRVAGSAVSYAEGVLVCPTGAGGIVAIDLTDRSLLWAWGFRRANAEPHRPAELLPQPQPAAERPTESVAIIADGRVLFTPRDSKELHCLNLADGQPLWSRPLGDALSVAGVREGVAFLVGPQTVQALKLTDGSAAWSKPSALPEAAHVCGRGFVAGDYLYLPVRTERRGQEVGAITVIEAATGRLAATTPTPGGFVPGNLVCSRGVLIAQGLETVTAIPLPLPGK